jgi:hypothetical protein
VKKVNNNTKGNEKMKKFKILGLIIATVFLCAAFGVGVYAADPIILDFSSAAREEKAYDVNHATEGWQADLGKWVFFEECDNGTVDASDSLGDTYVSIDVSENPIDAATYQWLRISIRNLSDLPKFEFHYGGDFEGIVAKACTHINISTKDTEYKSYIINIPETNKATFPVHPAIDLAEDSNWQGNISTFRLDFGYLEESGGHAKNGDKMYLEYVAFFDSQAAAEGFVFTPERMADANGAAVPYVAPPEVIEVVEETPAPDAGTPTETAPAAQAPAANAPVTAPATGDATVMFFVLMIGGILGAALVTKKVKAKK